MRATREIIPSPCIFSYSLLHCQTIVQILHHLTVAVNSIEVTVNICSCTDVFTIITTKDKSGGIYNSHKSLTTCAIMCKLCVSK